jgi:dihydroorotate dehydrogenase
LLKGNAVSAIALSLLLSLRSMALLPYSLPRSVLFRLNPELAHDWTVQALSALQNTPLEHLWSTTALQDPVEVAGLRFPNRVGMAAGLDKNGKIIDALGAMGFGFVEVGTVTPQPQAGNPKPRMFRLPHAQALINRMGFNNDGLETFLLNISQAHFREKGGILGLNIGKNSSTPIEQATADYLTCLDGVYPHADYVAVNISSPNTKNLRDLQSDDALDSLLMALQERRLKLAQSAGRHVPIFVKIAPDLDERQVSIIALTLQKNGIDGVIATNTTVNRDAVIGLPHSEEAGGLSGQPVREASNRVIRQLRAVLGSRFPIIGVGGIMSAADARAKRDAGADLVQLYTGLIYEGPDLIRRCAKALQR